MYQYPDYLMHHGVKGMKWGVRKQRVTSGKTNRRSSKSSMSEADKKARRRRNMKIAAGVAGGVAAAALATYGAYKFNDFVNTNNYKYHRDLGFAKAEQFKQNYIGITDKHYSSATNKAVRDYRSGKIGGNGLISTRRQLDKSQAMRESVARGTKLDYTSNPKVHAETARLGAKFYNKKNSIIDREIKKTGTDSFRQATKNAISYHKTHKRKRH